MQRICECTCHASKYNFPNVSVCWRNISRTRKNNRLQISKYSKMCKSWHHPYLSIFICDVVRSRLHHAAWNQHMINSPSYAINDDVKSFNGIPSRVLSSSIKRTGTYSTRKFLPVDLNFKFVVSVAGVN